jgi:alpha-galactosidase
MRIIPSRVEVAAGERGGMSATSGIGEVSAGRFQVELAPVVGGYRWSITNTGDEACRIRSVFLVFRVEAAPPIRMLRNGYQSWSPSGVATFGADSDPSTQARFEFVQGVYHADQRTVTHEHELRSEWVTVLTDATASRLLVGFDGGSEHDGTLRLRPGEGGVELWAEAFLGDANLEPGTRRSLHDIVIDDGPDAPFLLDRWARRAGRAGQARTDAPYQIGWCSWYHYFGGISERDLLANLRLAGDWPFTVFQLDDGYQSTIGDWLTTNDRFPSGLEAVSRRIADAGFDAGIWLAPFVVAPDSAVITAHPDWVARTPDGTEPLYGWWNPAWGGGRDGFMFALDTTHPEVQRHLEQVGRTLVEMGFGYLKLDFTFAPSFDGRWADAHRTPAERVRAGFDAIRRGTGGDAFILGCGVPLANVVGLVDGCRIGPDVAPVWALDRSAEMVPGYLAVQPATAHAYRNTVVRSFMHRRLWLNDPDCIMLRDVATDLSPEAAHTWARVVGLSGGMALVSDDLSLLDARARSILEETVSLGRASDDAARGGPPPAALDLMDAPVPTTFSAVGQELVIDPATGLPR